MYFWGHLRWCRQRKGIIAVFLSDMRAKKSIGMHWGTFILTDEPVKEPPILLKKELIELNLSSSFFQVVKPGEVLSLN